jgi:hypothetical protein
MTSALITLSAVHVALADVPTYAAPSLQLRSNIVDGFNLPPNSTFNSGTPALGDDGSVAMRLIVVGDTGRSGIWRGPGDGTGAVIAEAPTDLLTGDAAIAADGSVIFEIFDVFSEGIFRVGPGGGTPELFVAPGGPFNLDFFSDPRPLAGGGLAFRGGNFAGDRWIRFTPGKGGGTQESLLAENDPGIGFIFVPDADDAGRIIGKVRLGSTSGSSPDEIRRYDAPGSFVVLAEDADADAASPFSAFDNSVGATPDGRATFTANLVGGGRGVFLAGDDGIVTIATTADRLVSDISFFRPVGNAAGVVAFRGTDGAGLDAIFVGDGTTLMRLVGEHDLIDTDLGLGRIDQNDGSVTFGGNPAIDADGSVAFAATLTPADDDQIEWGTGMFVARATPAGDPADVNGDGTVDFDDLLAVLAAFGTDDPDADVDGDGTVEFDDLLAVLAAFGG